MSVAEQLYSNREALFGIWKLHLINLEFLLHLILNLFEKT